MLPEPTLNHKAAAALLASAGISISEAARRIDEDRSHLSNVLSGRRRGGARIIRKLSDLLGKDPYTLIGPNDPVEARQALIAMAREYGITGSELDAAS